MIYLIDKKLMPGNGMFIFEVMSAQGFTDCIQNAFKEDMLDNRVMDPEMNSILSEVTQTDIPLCPLAKGGGEITLETLDMLISVNAQMQPTGAVDAAGEHKDLRIIMDAISATHFDSTPEGIVEAIILIQAKSDIPREEWYTQLRNQLLKEVPVSETPTKIIGAKVAGADDA